MAIPMIVPLLLSAVSAIYNADQQKKSQSAQEAFNNAQLEWEQKQAENTEKAGRRNALASIYMGKAPSQGSSYAPGRPVAPAPYAPDMIGSGTKAGADILEKLVEYEQKNKKSNGIFDYLNDDSGDNLTPDINIKGI